jgi:hypothetical protein
MNELSQEYWTKVRDGEIDSFYYKYETWLEKQVTDLRNERDEMQQLFDLQHTRTVKADKLFQSENEVDWFPDLGHLIDWLLTRYEKLRVELNKEG